MVFCGWRSVDESCDYRIPNGMVHDVMLMECRKANLD